jgi:hypothetical protein
MLVYRDQRSPARPELLLAAARAGLTGLLATADGLHDRCVRLLIDLGTLEAAVTDQLCPQHDELHPLAGALRAASVAAGHLVCLAWRGQREAMSGWTERVQTALDAAGRHELPRRVELTVPEGYAYYGLYPETYIVASDRALQACPMPQVVCLGLRSIGASLSAVVAAAVAEAGREVVSFTLRPHGPPFDRRPRLGQQLAASLGARKADLFLVVDEGPGLSGSSFAGVGRALERLGVPEDHIAFLPSWRADGRALRSEDARRQWPRRLQFTASFEEVWLDSRRLERLARGRPITDVSAGRWRSRLFEVSRYPAVQPQHERRKFVVGDDSGGGTEGPDLIVRFAGLGTRGESIRSRAERLARAGWAAPPVALQHGLLAQPYRRGVPATREDGPALIPTLARYLAHLRQCHPTAEMGAELCPMVEVNASEALGAAAGERAVAAVRAAPSEQPVALDGRMLPHEWLRTDTGFVKVDNLDHHDDHFYPGAQDIAWDLAAACLEFGLEGEERRGLIELYRSTSGDRAITARLPGYAVAYLCCRLGYSAMAAATLGSTPDGERFGACSRSYQRQLARELDPDYRPSWEA